MAGVPKRLLVCRSNDFKVDYSINPWMKPGASDPEAAVRQWQAMVEVIRATGAEVEIVEFPADSPQELIWTRDAFTLHNGRIILANFKHDVRREETPYYRDWFETHGFAAEPAAATMEGGNLIPFGGIYFYGTGVRGDATDAQKLSEQLQTEIVPLAVTGDAFFHIDLALITLDDDNAFYYPPAFAPEAIEALKSRVGNLQELSEEEMNGYCANSITVVDQVIIQTGNDSFRQKLEALGKQVHEVDVSEFKNIGGGGIHCLTNVLEWS